MSNERVFVPEFAVVATAERGVYTVEELADETGMYSASPRFVQEHGGPVTRHLLSLIPDTFYAQCDQLGFYPNFDVRVHRLYPGDYPAVPGWHCDGEYRAGWQSQPDLFHNPPHLHYIVSVSTEPGGVSNTEIVSEEITAVIDPASPVNVWEQVHKEVEKLRPATISVSNGQLVSMSSFTLHRATPAVIRGWRLFLRASMWHKPYLSGEGKISRQEHVYRLHESLGW